LSAAYIGFVNFANARELLTKILIFLHSDANPMSHIPRGFISYRKLALKFFSGDALLVRADEVDRKKPLCQAHMRVVKDGANSYGELVIAVHAFVDVPLFSGLPFSIKDGDAGTVAAKTLNTFRPSNLLKMPNAFFFSGEFVNHLKDRGLSLHELSMS
jgi:hypothetical protein